LKGRRKKKPIVEEKTKKMGEKRGGPRTKESCFESGLEKEKKHKWVLLSEKRVSRSIEGGSPDWSGQLRILN